MSRLLHHKLGIILSLAVIGAVALAGVSFTSSLASSPTAQTVASPAMPAIQLPVSGFTEVAKAVTPAVVNITTSMGDRGHEARGQRDRMRERMDEFFGSPWGPFGSPWGPRMPQDQPEHRRSGMGSGVIVTPDGHIITNNHVIDGARELTVTLPDKREFKGKVIGTDPKTDLALIKVEARELPYVAWGDSSKLQVGEYVLAVGNPFGLNSTVTLGIVSALGRGRMGITQTQGALVSDVNEDSPAEQAGIKQGDVIIGYQGSSVQDPVALQRSVTRTPIGTKAAVKVARNGNEMDLTVTIGEQPDSTKVAMAEQGSSDHPLAGVAVQELDRQTARELGFTKKTQGVVVMDVEPDSPASQAGLTSGDVIREIHRQPVKSLKDYEKITSSLKKDQQVLLLINRKGASLFLTVKV